MRKIALLVIGVLILAGVVSAGTRFSAPIPSASLVSSGSPIVVVLPGQRQPLVNVAQGSLAAVAGGMRFESIDADTAKPIASIAKVMTALAVLDLHPLTPNQAGPTITLSNSDVAFWNQVVAENGSNLPVTAGEILNEQDLLEALLLPSANNIAFTLAVWTDGSVSQFLVRLNSKAVALGLTKTNFTDPSGLDIGTVSSANDLLNLAQVAMNNPTFAQIVALATATLSNGQTVTNRDQDLAIPGWLGIKTGTTDAAGYCLMFAVQRVLSGSSQPVTVFGVLLSQADSQTMFSLASQIADSVFANLGWVDVSNLAPVLNVQLHDAWHTTVPVNVGKPTAHELLTAVGTRISLTLKPQLTFENEAPGTRVGELDATVGGTGISWPLTLASALPPAPINWRLLRN